MIPHHARYCVWLLLLCQLLAVDAWLSEPLASRPRQQHLRPLLLQLHYPMFCACRHHQHYMRIVHRRFSWPVYPAWDMGPRRNCWVRRGLPNCLANREPASSCGSYRHLRVTDFGVGVSRLVWESHSVEQELLVHTGPAAFRRR
ncbi:hypothetical protein BDZ88DRAFT_268471 [Geranomyces variabilis]|nr:hypothetical protein BDZ88DRAFT_268471 [Geranomyces variabilis]